MCVYKGEGREDTPENVKVAVGICNLYGDNEFRGTQEREWETLGYHSCPDKTTPIICKGTRLCERDKEMQEKI